ncbi:actin binding protein [Pelomyxa schiedti]|nr:actin binding protein [Pelomyxa schiedti]
MADVSDPALVEAYKDVRSDATPTNWVLCGYPGPNSNKIVVVRKSEGPYEELLAELKEDQCLYAFARFITGDAESKRAKFVFISWVGERVSPIKRAKVSVHKPALQGVFANFALAVHGTTTDDLEESKVRTQLIKAGGANYSGNVANSGL